MAPASQETSRPFVGRAQELQLLAAALAEAKAGRARCVLVTGEPGIGKTSLVERLLADLAHERVDWGRCNETEGAPAYWPWIQVVRGLIRHRSVAGVRQLAGAAGLELARLVPALGDQQTPALDDEDDREAARFRLFDTVATLVRRAGADELLAVVLEDLHWADSESLLLLDHVAGELRDTRVLLLGTYREAELSATTSAPKLLAAVAHAAERVALGGLAADEVAGLLAGSGGTKPAAALVSAVHRATGGNPFFVA
ncbi:MAG: AAA family ATPase, partial [Thermodesulfobacteriota bacterium]